MASKKSSSKRTGRARRRAPVPHRPPADRRAPERTPSDVSPPANTHELASMDELSAFLRAHPAPPPSTALDQAQVIMYQAWDSRGRRRVELAHLALATCEDCADAYALLAEEEARSLEEARDLLERGVRAGERAIGPERFQGWTGAFWGVIDTRPYMRARAGLANALWHLGRREEAIAHYQEMLRLNPSDNQGLRYVLANCLLEVRDDQALGNLLDQYPDEPTADWLYTRALWLFRCQGASPEAGAALEKALAANPNVVLYLLEMKRLPRHLPDRVGVGDESEAAAYVAESAARWYETEGATEWFVRILKAMMAADGFGPK